MDNKLLIGIAGGTASGKSAIARTLLNHFKPSTCAVIKVDSYYHDLKHLPMIEREKNNFDDPKSIDFDFLLDQLTQVENNKSIKVPMYDYKTHTRTENYNTIELEKLIYKQSFSFYFFLFFLFLSYSFLFSININASSIVISLGSFSSGIVALRDLYFIYGPN